MKTEKPQNIELGPDAKKAKIKEAIKKGNAKAGFVDYTEDDIQKEIDVKKTEFVKKQKQYRVYLKDVRNAVAGLKYQEKLIEFNQQELEEWKIQKQMPKESENRIKWNGIQYPDKLLENLIELKNAEIESYRTQYNRDIEKYVEILNSFKRLEEELEKKYLMTKEEIESILDGKYVDELRS